MELFEDPAFKSKYQKHKLRVKLWESDFLDKHARRPNKNDIKEADVSIRESYKMYWKLKTRALEETLMDITFSDDVSNSTEEKTVGPTTTEGMKSLADGASTENGGIIEEKKKVDGTDRRRTKDAENIDPHRDPDRSEREPAADASIAKPSTGSENVDGVWGEHLSRANEPPPRKRSGLSGGRSSSFQLSQNKFSSLTKRNPRKSLSSSKLRIKSEKSMEAAEPGKPERADGGRDGRDVKDGFEPSELRTEMFPDVDGGLRVSYAEAKPVTHSLNAIQELIEGRSSVNRSLNQGWLDRCTQRSNSEYPVFDTQRLSATSDSGVESMESSIHSPNRTAPAPGPPLKPCEISDDEDFVCNSDSEEERKKKRVRNDKKKPTAEQETRPAKRSRVLETVSFAGTSTATKPSDFAGTEKLAAEETGEHLPTVPAVGPVKNEENKTEAGRPKKPVGFSEDHTSGDHTNDKMRTRKRNGKNIDDKGRVRTRTRGKRTAGKKTGGGQSRSPRAEVEDDAENDGAAGEEPKGEAIYGVETGLQGIPRFTGRTVNSGDLVQQFSETVRSVSEHQPSNSLPEGSKKTGTLTEREKLAKKVAAGKVNENFVRINLKKKVFVRGKKNFNFSKYKKNQWKERKKELGSSAGSLDVADLAEKNGGVLTCFKCGDVGHFSRRCTNAKGEDLLPFEEVDETSEFPTLEEAHRMATRNAVVVHADRIDRLPEKPRSSCDAPPEPELEERRAVEGPSEVPGNGETNDHLWEPIEDEEILFAHKIPEDLASKLLPPEIDPINSFYSLKEDRSVIETPGEVFETLRMFGHEKFRAGQEKAVMRILSGLSTLVTLSTGSGKSLCYQLPAYLYSKRSNCITLVISPLVSLMDDQVTGVPSFLSAACLHTNQTEKVRANVMEMVRKGMVHVLLVSPEAVVAGEKSTGFGALLRQLPPIAFACIDEAHCISQWSHNFRPSYLMVCRVLRERLKVKTVLALTATATNTTAASIVELLNIPDGIAGIISDIPIPRNLLLTVSKDIDRDNALICLLRSERFRVCDSVIVYCTRREECARLAAVLRTSLQDPQKPDHPAGKISSVAEAYHAGLSAHRRKIVQKAFMNGQTRIVVATIAFGMGLNKSDIRSVIHYNMPSTFEGYVQEIGRAGRDGLEAHCHLFLSPTEDHDKWELKRHVYANGVDRYTIRRLLEKVFVPCCCAKLRRAESNRRCPGHEVAIPVDETVSVLDISEETIATLLCYLELHPKKFITVLSSVYSRAKVSSYNGPQALKQAAQSSPPLAMAIALDLQKGISHENSSVIEFPVVDVASAIGWDSGVVKSQLKGLEWKTVNGTRKRSAISVRYDKLGLRVRAPGDLTEAELDEALDALVTRTQSQEMLALQQLEAIDAALHTYAVPTVSQSSMIDDTILEKSESLKGIIRSYFTSGQSSTGAVIPGQKKAVDEAEIANDVRALVLSYRDCSFTGRAVARIFYGIQSPNYPAYVWGKCRFWRAHLSCDFGTLSRIATKEILALR